MFIKYMNTLKKCIIVLLFFIIVLNLVNTNNKQLDNIIENLDNQDSKFKVPIANRKILILYTGGTIGMVETADGYSPKKGYLEKKINTLLGQHSSSKKIIADYHIKEYEPLLDSSNMTPKNWNTMLKDIDQYYNDYDSFIVIHGTDTMSYTASALSFAIQQLDKQIIVTGSQIPIQRLRNDGQDNLLTSLILASNYNIPEVLLVFSNSIMRGNRSKKISSNKLQAFSCPNFNNLGAFGYAQYPEINDKKIFNPVSYGFSSFAVNMYNTTIQVITIFLTPGINFEYFKNMFVNNHNIKGVLLVTFGIGDGPVANGRFLELLQVINDRNAVAVNISQCVEGRVDMDDYETGSALKKYNVISGKDMTLEAAYCKLLFLLSYYKSNTEIVRQKMEKNLRGELLEHLGIKNVDANILV